MVETHGDNYQFYVIASDTDWGESAPLGVATDRWLRRGSAYVLYTRAAKSTSILRALWLGRRLKPDFVYINSFLSPRFSIFPIALSRVGFFGRSIVVVAPRGEFGDAALAIKPRKKALFLAASKIIGLHRRVVWHASSEVEASEIRTIRPRANIKVRLNESNLPRKALRRHEPCGEHVKLVFVSRISEIKGVTLLLEALSHVTAGKVSLDLYGSAQNAHYLHECREIAAQIPANITVTFHGSVENSEVRRLFMSADAFFLPTEHENFGHAIAESLSAGCPTYIEDVTPWTQIIEGGGGRVVPEHTVSCWSEAIEEFCTALPETRTEMKRRAADAYERWRAGHEGPSIFDLILTDRSS
ncbi:glycosyltransferase [Dietzia sp. B32]|uniref:glycosyltransferase n=1 Tax=Dietzia sp. B32 TaxID=2915130 RepID=UPI0021ADDEA3|nr:glycosyltransferase [Dietzia sp. B32]UVE96440.1 glycosyltransferase [Dietzia sp. B32]